MSKHAIFEQEIALYDAMGRAIANLYAALAEIDAAWVIVWAERPVLRSPPSWRREPNNDCRDLSMELRVNRVPVIFVGPLETFWVF